VSEASDIQRHEREATEKQSDSYEAPSITVIGSFDELTAGHPFGSGMDAFYNFHHSH
jgi:hypothetical protein